MSDPEQQNKRTIRSFFETVINGKQYDLLSQYCRPDIEMNRPGGVVTVGLDAYEEHYRDLHTTFADLEATLTDIVGDENTVATRFMMTGIHEGEIIGIPPTGKRVSFSAQVLYRFTVGTIAKEFHQSDLVTLRDQLQR